jgi:hypothetical protein
MKSLFTYTAVILMVLYFSGFNKELTFYNRHLVTLYGTSVHTGSLSASKTFYLNLLELPLLEETIDRLSFRLPDNRILSIVHDPTMNPTQAPREVLTIRVRNGLPRLRESIKNKISNKFSDPDNPLHASVSISDMISTKRGREFHLTDPSNNQITFFQRSIFSRGR